MPTDETTTSRTSLTRDGRLSIKRLRPADLYDAWLFAESDATLALAAWRSAPDGERGDAYATYVAALDREARAAGLLELRLSPTGLG